MPHAAHGPFHAHAGGGPSPCFCHTTQEAGDCPRDQHASLNRPAPGKAAAQGASPEHDATRHSRDACNAPPGKHTSLTLGRQQQGPVPSSRGHARVPAYIQPQLDLDWR